MHRAVEELDGREINQKTVKLAYKIREEWASANGDRGGRERSRSRSRS